jgi:hypothetical protein
MKEMRRLNILDLDFSEIYDNVTKEKNKKRRKILQSIRSKVLNNNNNYEKMIKGDLSITPLLITEDEKEALRHMPKWLSVISKKFNRRSMVILVNILEFIQQKL